MRNLNSILMPTVLELYIKQAHISVMVRCPHTSGHMVSKRERELERGTQEWEKRERREKERRESEREREGMRERK